MISELEKNFFKISFKKIAEHSKLKKIKLTNSEIINHRKEIKSFLNIVQKCSDKYSFCKSLQTHFEILRNDGNEIVFKPFICNRVLAHWEIEEEEINKLINKYVNFYLHTSRVVCASLRKSLIKINDLYQNHKTPPLINKDINNIGQRDEKIDNKYLCLGESQQDIIFFYIYSFVLRQRNVIVINAKDLKKEILDNNFAFSKEDKTMFFDIVNVSFLIIVDLGYENNINQLDYYLDYFYDFLNKRHVKQLTTIIVSNLEWLDIKNNLLMNAKFQAKNKIQQNKLLLLDKLFTSMFAKNF